MTRRGDAWAEEMRSFCFHDKRIQLSVEERPGARAVVVTLVIRVFDSVDAGVGEQGVPIPIYRSDVFDMEMNGVTPEEALRRMWRSMWEHEFQEQLQRGGMPVHDPHGISKKQPGEDPTPKEWG